MHVERSVVEGVRRSGCEDHREGLLGIGVATRREGLGADADCGEGSTEEPDEKERQESAGASIT